MTSLAATSPSSFRFFSMALLRSRAARSSALSVHPMFPEEWAAVPSCPPGPPCPSLRLAASSLGRALSATRRPLKHLGPGLRAETRTGSPKRSFLSANVPLSSARRPLSRRGWRGGGVVALEPAGSGLLSGGEGGKGGVSSSIFLQGGDDDDGERKRFHLSFQGEVGKYGRSLYHIIKSHGHSILVELITHFYCGRGCGGGGVS